jgi:hypothetical protein
LESKLAKDGFRLKFLCEKLSNVAMPRDMSDIDKLGGSGIANGDFTDIEVAEFLGHSAACGPIDAAFVIVEEWEAKRSVPDVGEVKIGHKIVEVFEGLAALIHGDNLGFTRATGSLAFTQAAPGERTTHAGDNMPEEGSDFVVNDSASIAWLGHGGVLGAPVGVGADLG